MADDLQVGDVVQLESGKPKMTVQKLSTGQAVCVWFEDGERKGSSFPPATLKKGPRVRILKRTLRGTKYDSYVPY